GSSLGGSESAPSAIGLITFGTKQTGKRSAGKPHAAFDVAGVGNVTMVAGLRSIAKAMELPPEPNVRAPALDPTLWGGAGNGSRSTQIPRQSLIRQTAFDELKTHLRGAHIVLRSKTPDLVRQEFYGLMMAHFAIRGLMHEAALKADQDPDRLSFLHAVRVIRRKLNVYGAIPPSAEENIS